MTSDPSSPSDPPDAAPRTLARERGPRGEVVLRRRGAVLELIVDGVFAMDDAHTTTERALADLAIERLAVHRPAPWRVLVGGLGLGHTTSALLRERRVDAVQVVELHPQLLAWARSGLIPTVHELLADPRLGIVIGDVLDVVPGLPPASLDAVLLDVDNGPDFLVHQHNAAVYETGFLTAALRALRPGGVLAIWSADPSPRLVDTLRDLAGDCEEVLLPVERDGRHLLYSISLALRFPTPASDIRSWPEQRWSRPGSSDDSTPKN